MCFFIFHVAIGLRNRVSFSVRLRKINSMAKNIPPLNALRAFEAASRHDSFVRAANELHVTPAAISHQIKQLEHWLSIELFERSARGVTLTPAGRDYAFRIREAFDKLMNTSAAVRANKARRVVVIRAQFSIAAMWLVHRIVEFNQSQSDIEIRVIADGTPINPLKSGTDLFVYHHRDDLEGWQQNELMRGNFSVYAAPSLYSRACAQTPIKWAVQPLIHFYFEDRAWKYPVFDDWFKAAAINAPAVLPGTRFNLLHLCATAAVKGAGFALLPDTLCGDEVREGRLVSVPGPSLPSPHPYFILSKKRATEEARFVRDWLLNYKLA